MLGHVEPVLGGSLLQSRVDNGFQLPLAGGYDASPLDTAHHEPSNGGKVKTSSIKAFLQIM
jgi:hypothetical protein